MASVQERLQIGRVPLDKWSTREQLCLASAVSCSGDQNWMSVSRTLKVLCGSSRPADWFSQKSCAVQYGHLLENVETTKRKKRSSESGSNSPTAGETPTDLILKRLAEERMQELKAEIRRGQEEFAKIHSELKSIQSGQLEEDDILEMWKEIEKEQEMQRIEEMKMENQLREREQQKQEMQRAWRPNAPPPPPAALAQNFPPVIDDKQTDVSLEEIIGSNKPIMGGNQPQATSPLLSSLLKSPTPGAAGSLGTTGHNSAPTITTLLTGGAIDPNQPAIVLKNTIPASEAVHLLTRPISGPPSDFSLAASTSAPQTLLSPSQSAPTLSMLLEKTKVPPATPSSTAVPSAPQENLVPAAPSVVEPVTKSKATNLLSDSNNEEVPMDIEEDVVEGTISTPDMGNGDSDADTNEEQQLLEVFKNIGNIDELADIDVAAVIDEEEDFLKSVGDEPTDLVEEMDFDGKSPAEDSAADHPDHKLSKNRTYKEKPDSASESAQESKAETTGEIKKDLKTAGTEKDALKPEIISSDDSNDNVPLANLGSSSNLIENKDTTNTNGEKESNKETDETFENKDEVVEQSEEDHNGDKITNINSIEDELEDATSCETILKDSVAKRNSSQKSPESESSDVIIIPTDDESNSDKQQSEKVHDENVNNSINKKDLSDLVGNKNNEDKEEICEPADDISESSRKPSKEVKETSADIQTPPATISLADTDEESSTTDASVSTKKEEKTKHEHQKLNLQHKKGNAESKGETKVEDEASQTPVKPPVIRKLRERDRSESPLTTLDDDTTASDQSAQRSRRRYSSTPIIDSIPNSPASSDRDDRDVRTSKKSLMNLYNTITTLKHASSVQNAMAENASRFKEICNRPMDFQVMKRNIEHGSTRSVQELQRDVLLLCQNALMVLETNSSDYKMVCEFAKDCQSVKEFITNGHASSSYKSEKEKEIRTSTSHASSPYSSGMKVRGSSRKSQRLP